MKCPHLPLHQSIHALISGNERILKAHGGKVRLSAVQSSLLADFHRCHEGEMVLLVAVEVRTH